MGDKQRPLLWGLQSEIGSLISDVRRMAALRWELARVELTSDFRAAAWLLAVAVAAVLMVIVALPLLLVALGQLLSGVWGIPQSGWLCIFGCGLIIVAVAGLFIALKRFKKNFIGLEETIEELHEDIVWLREWSEGAEADRDDNED